MLELSSLFAKLPDDVLANILSYGNQMKYRQGKFMGRILPNDPRILLMRKIPRPIHILPLLDILNDEGEIINNTNIDKINRVYISLKKDKKEIIHHYFTKDNVNYYDFIYLSKGRLVGYVSNKLYRIEVIQDSTGHFYNQYIFVTVNVL
jgi:hypothetical protein